MHMRQAHIHISAIIALAKPNFFMILSSFQAILLCWIVCIIAYIAYFVNRFLEIFSNFPKSRKIRFSKTLNTVVVADVCLFVVQNILQRYAVQIFIHDLLKSGPNGKRCTF